MILISQTLQAILLALLYVEPIRMLNFSKIMEQLRLKAHGSLPPDLSAQAKWDYSQFKSFLRESLKTDYSVHHTPDTIEMGSLGGIIRDVRKRTSVSGLEHGRHISFNSLKNKLICGQLFSGEPDKLGMEAWIRSRGGVVTHAPIVCVHSHPRKWNETARAVEHFSHADFRSLMQSKFLRFSMVCAMDGLNLLLMKSTASLCVKDHELMPIMKETESKALELAKGGAEWSRIFTKLSCIELGLSLYRVDLSEDKVTAKKILLVNPVQN